MKKTITVLFLLILSPMAYSQFQLQKGNNPTIQYGTLTIEPVNLFVQERPWNNRSPHIQLELNIIESKETTTAFLRHYDETNDMQVSNYPHAFGKHVFSLNIKENDEVELNIEKTDFDKEFILGIQQEAILGNLTILFNGCFVGWSILPDGGMVNDTCDCSITLSEKNKKETFVFEPLDKYENNQLFFEWNNYKVELLYVSENFIKLKAIK